MRKIFVFIIINIISFFFQLYVLMPQCQQFVYGKAFPSCFGKEQVIFLIALAIFDIFYIVKYFVLPQIKKQKE